VAGHDEPDRTRLVRGADGAHGGRRTDRTRERGVGRRRAGRDLAQCRPDTALERGADELDPDRVERSDVAGEVVRESRAQLARSERGPQLERRETARECPLERRPHLGKGQRDERARVVAREAEWAERRVELAEREPHRASAGARLCQSAIAA